MILVVYYSAYYTTPEHGVILTSIRSMLRQHGRVGTESVRPSSVYLPRQPPELKQKFEAYILTSLWDLWDALNEDASQILKEMLETAVSDASKLQTNKPRVVYRCPSWSQERALKLFADLPKASLIADAVFRLAFRRINPKAYTLIYCRGRKHYL